MDLLKIERICHSHDEADLRIVILQDPGCFKNIREEGVDLSDTAPREETDHWLGFVDAISMNGFSQWSCIQDLVDQRMTDKGAIHPGLLVNRRFKGEDDDHLLYPLGQEAQPPFFPCPYLWTDIIDDRYAAPLSHSGLPHPLSSDPCNLHRNLSVQVPCQVRPIDVSRDFARDHQNFFHLFSLFSASSFILMAILNASLPSLHVTRGSLLFCTETMKDSSSARSGSSLSRIISPEVILGAAPSITRLKMAMPCRP